MAELKVEASEADDRADIELDLIRAVAGIDLDAEERREGALPSVVFRIMISKNGADSVLFVEQALAPAPQKGQSRGKAVCFIRLAQDAPRNSPAHGRPRIPGRQ